MKQNIVLITFALFPLTIFTSSFVTVHRRPQQSYSSTGKLVHWSLSRNDCKSRDHHSSVTRCYSHRKNNKRDDGIDRIQDGCSDELHNNRRRKLLTRTCKLFASSVTTSTILSLPTSVDKSSVWARGLVQFPCTDRPLDNTYHLMRAGTTMLEEEDIWSTNPLFLTNSESALSDKGVDEVRDACRILRESQISPSIVKHSFAKSSLDSATVIKEELKIGQNRIVPEFNFMDPRALGKWDMMSLRQTQPAIFAMDDLEAGKDGTGGRPPPNDDGTPNETLADNAVRLAQLMSVLETQYAGDNILLVFPDGTSPALLSAMIAGIPYNKVHELEYKPGEVRINVNAKNTIDLYESLSSNRGSESNSNNNISEEYEKTINNGRKELERLRSLTDEDRIVSKKDQKIEDESLAIEEQVNRRREDEERRQREKQEQINKSIQERERRQREKQEESNRRKEEAERRKKQKEVVSDDRSKDDTSSSSISNSPLLVGGGLGAVAAAVSVVLSTGSEEEEKESSIDLHQQSNVNITTAANTTTSTTTNTNTTSNVGDDKDLGTISNTTTIPTENVTVDTNTNITSNNMQIVETTSKESGKVHTDESKPIAQETTGVVVDPEVSAKVAMDEYLDQDDGSEAWLQMMESIINEDDDDEDVADDNDDDDDDDNS